MKIFSRKKASKTPIINKPVQKEELQKKAVEGAKKALKEYKRVFERLAEYDRV